MGKLPLRRRGCQEFSAVGFLGIEVSDADFSTPEQNPVIGTRGDGGAFQNEDRDVWDVRRAELSQIAERWTVPLKRVAEVQEIIRRSCIREPSNDFLSHAVGQLFLLRVARKVLKWQNRKRAYGRTRTVTDAVIGVGAGRHA
jgi:hypothetical protein